MKNFGKKKLNKIRIKMNFKRSFIASIFFIYIYDIRMQMYYLKNFIPIVCTDDNIYPKKIYFEKRIKEN